MTLGTICKGVVKIKGWEGLVSDIHETEPSNAIIHEMHNWKFVKIWECLPQGSDNNSV